MCGRSWKKVTEFAGFKQAKHHLRLFTTIAAGISLSSQGILFPEFLLGKQQWQSNPPPGHDS